MACPPAFSNKRLLLWGETWRTRHRRNQSSIASWSPHLGAAGKCEHWRSIDLADLRRMGLLVEALNRHRGKGQQKVTVEHVTVGVC